MKTMRTDPVQRAGLIELCGVLPSIAAALEIGSYLGESAEIFLASGKIQHITCVDTFRPTDCKHASGVSYEPEFDRRLQPFAERVRKVRATSRGAAILLRERTYGFIYIDAAHDYRSVKEDISTWIRFLEPGGWIGGHDWIGKGHKGKAGVIQAVRDWFGKPDYVFSDGSWLCKR